MKYVSLISFITVLRLSVYCFDVIDIDEAEPDEYAYKWDNVAVDHLISEVRRNRRSGRHTLGYGISRGSGRTRTYERYRKGVRFRSRLRSRRPFAPSVRKPASVPSVRKPSVATHSVNRPHENSPNANKPGANPALNGGNGMVPGQNPLLANSNPGTYQGGNVHNPNAYGPPPYNPNVYRPPVNPAPIGGNGMGQQPNQNSNSRPGMPIPIPIPIPLGNPFGSRNQGAHNRGPHNESSHNQSSLRRDVKGRSGYNKYHCSEFTKRLLFTIITISVVVVYYLE